MWFASPAGEAAARRLAAMLTAEFGDKPLFAVKDPRICRLTPLWLRACELAQIDVRMILVLRNPLEVAASLKVGKGVSRAHSMLIWLRYVLDAERNSRSCQRVFLTYDALLSDWREAMRRVSSTLGFSWPRWTIKAELEIDAFLDSQHRHHLARETAIKRRADVPQWVADTHRLLASVAQGGEPGAIFDDLDRTGVAFDVACSAFAPLFLDEREAAETANRKRRLMKGELDRAVEIAERLQEEAQSRDVVLAEQRIALAEREVELLALREQGDEAMAKAFRLEQDLAKLQGCIMDLEAREQSMKAARAEEDARLRSVLRDMGRALTSELTGGPADLHDPAGRAPT